MQERLHIDEIRRVEKAVNALLKSWRRLNREHEKLEHDFAAMSEQVATREAATQRTLSELEARHAAEKTRLEDEQQRALNAIISEWQDRCSELERRQQEALEGLQKEHAQRLQEMQTHFEETLKKTQEALNKANKIKDALIKRVRGVADE